MPPAAADAPAATLRVKFWPEPSKWDDRRRRPRSNTQPMQFAVAEIVPAADKFRELLQKLIAPDTSGAHEGATLAPWRFSPKWMPLLGGAASSGIRIYSGSTNEGLCNPS